MYEEQVKRLREESEIERWLQPHSANETPKLLNDAADAIEELSGLIGRYGGETGIKNLQEYADKYWDLLKNAPRWIPVTETLPEELKEVNIAWMNTAPAPYYDFIKGKTFTGSAVYYKGQWFWYSAVCSDYLSEYGFSPNDSMDDAIKVTHWMPLPEPPKEET